MKGLLFRVTKIRNRKIDYDQEMTTSVCETPMKTQPYCFLSSNCQTLFIHIKQKKSHTKHLNQHHIVILKWCAKRAPKENKKDDFQKTTTICTRLREKKNGL